MERRYSQRAEVILLSLEGKTLDEIIRETATSKPIVNKWRQRFRKYGIEGLKDTQRSGKPSVITDAQKAMVMQKACEKPSDGYTNWSQKRIARAVCISQSKVHQISVFFCSKKKRQSGLPKLTNATGQSLGSGISCTYGKITAKTMKSNNTENFLSFLKKLDRTYHNKTLHIIVDNLSVHKNQSVKE